VIKLVVWVSLVIVAAAFVFYLYERTAVLQLAEDRVKTSGGEVLDAPSAEPPRMPVE
jgi:hypothetical protein